MVAPVLKSFQAEVRAGGNALGAVGVTCTGLPCPRVKSEV